MSTYHQYSEIVAAYGNRMPPPQQQTPRLALPFIYAAIGLVLGTFTGTAAGLISLQPGVDSVASHLSLASLRGTDFKIHPIANASQTPVIQNHANMQAVHPAEPAPTVTAATQSPAVTPAVTKTAPAETMQDHASASSQPAVQTAHLDKPSAIPGHVDKPVAHASQSAAALAAAPAVKPTVNLAAAVPVPAPLKAVSKVASTVATIDQAQAVTPSVTKPVILAKLTVPAAVPTPAPDAAPPTPLASYTLGMDSGAKPQLFFSEGDATVVSYSAAGDTIQTDDGRTFMVGTTVSVSSAASWDDYRANVHYRCDQNGHCTLTRSGVIALNAKLI